MTRRLLILAAAIAVWLTVAAAAPAASLPVVELLTTSSSVSQADLVAVLPAVQTAVSRDLAAAWSVDATLTVGDATRPAPADMTVTVSDSPDCPFCLGYHWFTPRGQPYAKVFVDPSESTWLTLTHELFEMLVDPQANRFARWHGRTWIVEVCDPPESGYYAYRIDGVDISDFILPRWYGVAGDGPFDFTGRLARPGQIGRHGYAAYLTAGGGWAEVDG